jgi:AAA+ ATPase superfamily predicted ATPase
LGGTHKYYVAIEDFDLKGKTALEIIDALFLSKSAPLDEEVNTVLSQEFGGRSGIYYSILEAIAVGNNRLSSIAGYLNVPATSITRQIGDLKDNFELIDVEKPYQGKRGIYVYTASVTGVLVFRRFIGIIQSTLLGALNLFLKSKQTSTYILEEPLKEQQKIFWLQS